MPPVHNCGVPDPAIPMQEAVLTGVPRPVTPTKDARAARVSVSTAESSSEQSPSFTSQQASRLSQPNQASTAVQPSYQLPVQPSQPRQPDYPLQLQRASSQGPPAQPTTSLYKSQPGLAYPAQPGPTCVQPSSAYIVQPTPTYTQPTAATYGPKILNTQTSAAPVQRENPGGWNDPPPIKTKKRTNLPQQVAISNPLQAQPAQAYNNGYGGQQEHPDHHPQQPQQLHAQQSWTQADGATHGQATLLPSVPVEQEPDPIPPMPAHLQPIVDTFANTVSSSMAASNPVRNL